MRSRYRHALQIVLLAVLATASASSMADDNWGHDRGDGHNGHLDMRHGHNRYYPPVGASFHVLPGPYITTHYHGVPFYFYNGIWYQHGGFGFSVVFPPVGAFITVLPPYYTTVWFGRVPYYYANNVYYSWDAIQHGYIVSQPPASDNGAAATAPPPVDDIFVYPKNGQSTDVQAQDRYECHRWAVEQTGFDPTQTNGADTNIKKREDYERAEASCLDAHGYSVK
jgi:hypothetical protein